MRDTLIGVASDVGPSLLSGNVTVGQDGSQVGSLGASMLQKAGMTAAR